MSQYNDLVEKLHQMKPSDVVYAMIESLNNPVINVDMATYGDIYRDKSGEYCCYGCAATNTICRLGGFNFIDQYDGDRGKIKYREDETISDFESAINSLRKGWLTEHNSYIELSLPNLIIPLAYLPFKLHYLPRLTTHTYIWNLPKYEELADYLKSIGH